jgi:hypothetical protein
VWEGSPERINGPPLAGQTARAYCHQIAEDTRTIIVLDISSLGYLRYVSKLARRVP